MGVVRDVTVDNLVTAVGNIDTSSLAQDSTLQDVVTAIGNISGGSDPVTNTTVNMLGKDTSLQSIAAAITGLGTALGSDKANIDGSNIANPSAFRRSIGIDGVLTGTTIKSGYIAHTTSATIPLGSVSSAVGLVIIFRPDTGLYSVISFYGNSKQTILGTLPSTVTININTATTSITINNSIGYTIPVIIIANAYNAL